MAGKSTKAKTGTNGNGGAPALAARTPLQQTQQPQNGTVATGTGESGTILNKRELKSLGSQYGRAIGALGTMYGTLTKLGVEVEWPAAPTAA